MKLLKKNLDINLIGSDIKQKRGCVKMHALFFYDKRVCQNSFFEKMNL